MIISRICQCGKIVKGKCQSCSKKKQWDTTREQSHLRGYGNDWRKLSKLYRTHNPLCERCKANGRVSAVEEVHHRKPIKTHPELRLKWGNLMSVCIPCHREIEREEHAS